MIEPLKNTGSYLKVISLGPAKLTNLATNLSNPRGNQPTQSGGALPDQVRLRLGSTPEFSSKADKHPGNK